MTISLPYDSYDPAKESLSVAYWNAEAETWEPLESEIDQSEKIVKSKDRPFLGIPGGRGRSNPGRKRGMSREPACPPLSGGRPGIQAGRGLCVPEPGQRRAKVPAFHIETGIADSVKIKIYTVSGRAAHQHTMAGAPAVWMTATA